MGLDAVKTFIAKLPAETIPLSEQGHGKDIPAAGAAPDGVDQRSHEAHTLAERYVAEGKFDSYEEAAKAAYSEVYA
jgi:hypothetical protein